jgi:hypothetical protein
MSTESCIKVFLNIMITCTNAFSATVGLIRIARTEFFRRQSVMSFADRREQLLAETGMWVKGGTCKIKESTLCGKTCH